MPSEQFSLCWEDFHKNISNNLQQFLDKDSLVDVTLAVDGQYIKAHKLILSLCSPYFKTLFEVNPCKHPIVFMKDVNYKVLKNLLQFMYCGEVQVGQDDLQLFIKTAEALQIKGLSDNCNKERETASEHQEQTEHIKENAVIPEMPLPIRTSFRSNQEGTIIRKRINAPSNPEPSMSSIPSTSSSSTTTALPPTKKIKTEIVYEEDLETLPENDDSCEETNAEVLVVNDEDINKESSIFHVDIPVMKFEDTDMTFEENTVDDTTQVGNNQQMNVNQQQMQQRMNTMIQNQLPQQQQNVQTTTMSQNPQQQQQPIMQPTSCISPSQPTTSNPVVTSQANNPQQPMQPIGGSRERHTIWQGVLEYLEKPKNIADQNTKLTRNVPCQVSANSKDGEPELKADSWPQKLIMQLMPKQLIGNIGGAYLKNSKSVLFHLQPCEALESLTKVTSSGFVGCVHFTRGPSASACDIKVLILLYTSKKRAYLGFIPNDQVAFVERLRKVIQQQKTSQAMIRQGHVL